MIFRFDDVCINSNLKLHNQMTDWLFEKFPDCEVIWAVSPLVCSSENKSQRVFPKIWNAYSDVKKQFEIDAMGIPVIHPKVKVATHGLIHIDHRLLTREQQEISILISASLVGSKTFVPPFNKWDKNTEEICYDNEITLIKFEEQWLCIEHNRYNEGHKKYYLHAREFTFESFKKWFDI